MAKTIYPFEVKHRDIWSIALPATFAFITEPLAGLVDITVIGRLGDANLLAGLVLGAFAFSFIMSFAFFLRLGTAGLVAQAVGAREKHQGLVHVVRSILMAVAIGVLLLALTPVLLWACDLLFAPEAEVVPSLATYLGTRLWSAPFALINFALLGWFYGRAEATTGMVLQILIGGGNIVFSILFVHQFGWGVWGVAFGTVLAEIIAASLGLYLVLRQFGGLRKIINYVPKNRLFDRTELGRFFALSRDLIIRTAALEATFVFFTAQASREGAVVLAASTIILNFQMITAFFLDGQAQAAEQLCGKAVGANYRPAFERAIKLAMIWGFGIGSSMAVVWLIGGPYLIDFMTTAPDVRATARDYMLIASLMSVTGIAAFVMDGVMTGATLNTVIRNGMLAALAVFLIVAITLQPLLGLNGLWIALHLFFIARGAIFWVAVQRKIPQIFRPD